MTYHSKHNVRSVEISYDGIFAKYYPEWFATRLEIIRVRKGKRYPVKILPENHE